MSSAKSSCACYILSEHVYHDDADLRVAIPSLQIKLSLSSNIFRHSAPLSEQTSITATTALATPGTLTLDVRGEFDSQTILDQCFRAEYFEFYDLTTDAPVVHSPFPATCDAGDYLFRRDVLEISWPTPRVTQQVLGAMNPLADPARQLEAGHEYRLRLKPQRIWCYLGSVEELFGDCGDIAWSERPEGMMITLASDGELVLKVESFSTSVTMLSTRQCFKPRDQIEIPQ